MSLGHERKLMDAIRTTFTRDHLFRWILPVVIRLSLKKELLIVTHPHRSSKLIFRKALNN